MRRWSTLSLVFLLAAAPGARANERLGLLPGYTVDTVTTAGYRVVDVGGSRQKYREDYDLPDGPRLFDFTADGHAIAPEQSHLDRFHLEIATPGNEPVQRYRLSLADRGLWDLRAAFTRSRYYYAVPQLWEAAVPGDVRTDDLHDWNFVRTNGTVDLTVHPTNLPTLFAGYRLFERDGRSISTVLVPAGDTFLLRAPVDDVTHVGRVGSEFSVVGADLLLQQEYRRVDRQRTLKDVLDPAGLDPTDGTRLDVLYRDQGEHLDIPATTVRARRLVGDRVELDGGYYYSHADLGVERFLREQGTATVPGLVPNGVTRGTANATFDTHVADAGLLVGLTEHTRLHADYRYDERSQRGDVAETSTFGYLAAHSGDQVRVHRVTAALEYAPRPNLDLRAGLRWSQREVNFPTSRIATSTDAVGAVARARWRPWAFLDLTASYENTQIDDPVATPGDAASVPPLPEREITLTYRNRGTLGLTLRPRDWISLRYQLVADHRTNDTFHGVAESFGNSVTLTMAPVAGMSLLTGYTRRDLSSRADILTAPLYATNTSLQNGTEDVFQSALQYEFTLLGQPWACGWDVAYVRSSNRLRPRL